MIWNLTYVREKKPVGNKLKNELRKEQNRT